MSRKSYEQLETELSYAEWQRDRAIDAAFAVVEHFGSMVSWRREATITDETIEEARHRVSDMLAAAGMGGAR